MINFIRLMICNILTLRKWMKMEAPLAHLNWKYLVPNISYVKKKKKEDIFRQLLNELRVSHQQLGSTRGIDASLLKEATDQTQTTNHTKY